MSMKVVDSEMELTSNLSFSSEFDTENIDAFLICDYPLDDNEELSVYLRKPVFWIGKIIENEYKKVESLS